MTTKDNHALYICQILITFLLLFERRRQVLKENLVVNLCKLNYINFLLC